MLTSLLLFDIIVSSKVRCAIINNTINNTINSSTIISTEQ